MGLKFNPFTGSLDFGGGAGGSGDVTGPASSVADNFASFLDTTGKVIKDSGSKASDFASTSHISASTGVHGVGAGTVAKVGDIAVDSNLSAAAQAAITASHARAHDINSASDHNASIVGDRGKFVKANSTTGAIEFNTIADADVPSSIARDSEVTTAISDHVGAADPHSAYALDSDLTTHAGASDPHTGYQKESEKSMANGYASLDATTRVPAAELATGTPDGTKFLRDDRTWQSPGASSTNIKQTEVDFGTTPVEEASFVVVDADVSPTSQLLAQVAYEAPTGKDLDELEMDELDIKCAPGSGQFTMYIKGMEGYIADKFKVNFLIG